VKQKVENASVEGGIHRDTGLSAGSVLLEDSSVCEFVWSRSFPSDDSNSAPGRAVVRPLQEESRQSGVGSAVGREGERSLTHRWRNVRPRRALCTVCAGAVCSGVCKCFVLVLI
jgi:hypothetical protein